jgi:hypothetical protein
MKACGTTADLCVQVVGVDLAGTAGSSRYYTVRNAWGTDWGHSGYMHLEFGANVCGVSNDVTFTKSVDSTIL